MEIEEIARVSVDCGYTIHKQLGPGLLESVYEVVLAKLLTDNGLCVERQKQVPIVFNGVRFAEGFRADLLVEDKLVVEIKSVDELAPVHYKQLLTYLRLLNLPLGLLMNFGASLFKDGIKRVVNNRTDFAASRAPMFFGNRRARLLTRRRKDRTDRPPVNLDTDHFEFAPSLLCDFSSSFLRYFASSRLRVHKMLLLLRYFAASRLRGFACIKCYCFFATSRLRAFAASRAPSSSLEGHDR
ncbi:MAG: GxxExxY protein [Syntrophobacteraceae bacterium]|nr:GxxExxY protein [Syntrophobacteraceae bacterium]